MAMVEEGVAEGAIAAAVGEAAAAIRAVVVVVTPVAAVVTKDTNNLAQRNTRGRPNQGLPFFRMKNPSRSFPCNSPAALVLSSAPSLLSSKP